MGSFEDCLTKLREVGLMSDPLDTFLSGLKPELNDGYDDLKGNGNPGRRLWMRYNEDEQGIKRLVNDLFTAGLLDKVDRTSIESLKTTIASLAGQTMYVRGWGWKREGDDTERQSVAVKSEKALKKLLAEKAESPF